MLNQIAELCLAHFLCQFDPKSKKRKTRDVVRKVALEFYSSDKVDEFLDSQLQTFQQTLVTEFNSRYADGRPLRFQICDNAGVGDIVEGNCPLRLAKEIRFQNALHKLTANEFEKLAAVI